MISIAMALKLKQAGLPWKPALHDFFTIPNSGLEDKIFVLSDLSAYLGLLHGEQVITFHGTVEWALDYIWLDEVLWLPTEAQLRDALEKYLPQAEIRLSNTPDGYICQIELEGPAKQFEAFGAVEAYGKALLHILQD